MRKIFILLFLLFFTGCAHECAIREQYYFSAPTVLPHVTTEMKTPGFWISRLNAPDEVIMTPREVEMFNQDIVRSELRDDIASFSDTYNGRELRDSIDKQIKELASAGYFMQDGRRPDNDFFTRIEKDLGLKDMPDKLDVKFAIVVSNCDQRLLPTKEELTSKPLDVDFDELQNSALDINTPVAVLWQNADKLWSYVVAPSSSGWVLTQNLAECAHDTIKKMLTNDFVVVTEAKADIYLDKEQKKFYDCVRMGTRLEVKNFSDDIVEIALPLRDENAHLKWISGYIRTKDLHRGYLLYTARMVIEQAFEMLNTPYGWGGANGEQDCSQFLQEVFATVGLEIPRNSSFQAKAGLVLCNFDENDSKIRLDKVIAKSRPGSSLMYMHGHIMLYLGEVNKIPYVIHDTWAYRMRIDRKDTPILINKVTVSDLSLGQDSDKGSLLDRLRSISILCKEYK